MDEWLCGLCNDLWREGFWGFTQRRHAVYYPNLRPMFRHVPGNVCCKQTRGTLVVTETDQLEPSDPTPTLSPNVAQVQLPR
jgi:hypothetical protein